jgi:hypothetical protein
VKKPDDSKKYAPRNAAEYLFANEVGEMANDLNSGEVDQIYSGYMDAMVTAYDKLKGKFNTFAAKCLSEK